MNENTITLLVSILTVLSAIFFAAGQVYYQGYLGAYGLDDSLLVQEKEKSILNGAFLLIKGITASMPILNFLMYCLLLLVLIIMLVPNHKLDINKVLPMEKIRSLQMSVCKINLLESFLNKIKLILVSTVVFILAYVAITFIISNTLQFGRTSAKKEQDAFTKGQGNIVMISIKDNNAPIKAKHITCGDQYCAFWLGDKALVLKTENIEQIQTEPKL